MAGGSCATLLARAVVVVGLLVVGVPRVQPAYGGLAANKGGSLFTSSANIHSLFSVEKDMAQLLKRYIQDQEHRLQQLKGLVDVIERTPVPPTDNDLEPQDSFGLLHRMVEGMQHVQELFENDVQREVQDALTNNGLPNMDDLKGGAQGLLRLQRVYALKPQELLPNASAPELLAIGQEAYNQNDMASADRWLEFALSKLDDASANYVTALDYLAFVAFKLRDLPRAIEYSERLLQRDPNNTRVALNLEYYNVTLNRNRSLPDPHAKDKADAHDDADVRHDRDNILGHSEEDMERFRRLCRGETLYHPQRPLTCELKHYNQPHLFLKPIKVEHLHEGRQRLQVFRQFASPEECRHLQHAGKRRLERAVAWTDGRFQPVEFRISTAAWLQPDHDAIVKRIHGRIEDATQVDIEYAEALQISNYGMGGFYEPHFDHSSRGTNPDGERLATFMIYLNPVKQGGFTAFPRLGAAVQPGYGDAVFWYNLQPSGVGDPLTLHGACPVLRGSKWVANKWIHERGNVCRKPLPGETFTAYSSAEQRQQHCTPRLPVT
ncbi:p4ha2 protein [Salpingoeca rosetta]|uniref:procollagen-proline 4-dioxygenase n=1 Tax=Salpingoeca rosetta (strain ATCC 50818 / BSB-021) TaxID=946362 RepID=F2U1X1_SALR5|nr:p4ha2 protein [Salpingoeca rosetta]EGD81623.1 p4ha2 protein [Salpingoeca rosetta]|eukprot:XP_004996827.1 p4ha2 protein [Salpingoeca rosetta]